MRDDPAGGGAHICSHLDPGGLEPYPIPAQRRSGAKSLEFTLVSTGRHAILNFRRPARYWLGTWFRVAWPRWGCASVQGPPSSVASRTPSPIRACSLWKKHAN